MARVTAVFLIARIMEEVNKNYLQNLKNNCQNVSHLQVNDYQKQRSEVFLKSDSERLQLTFSRDAVKRYVSELQNMNVEKG